MISIQKLGNGNSSEIIQLDSGNPGAKTQIVELFLDSLTQQFTFIYLSHNRPRWASCCAPQLFLIQEPRLVPIPLSHHPLASSSPWGNVGFKECQSTEKRPWVRSTRETENEAWEQNFNTWRHLELQMRMSSYMQKKGSWISKDK